MVYAFLAEGFEETEAILPLDLLIRAGIPVRTVAIGESRTVPGAHGLPVVADVLAEQLPDLPEDAEMIFLPGGMPGTKNLEESPAVQNYIRQAVERNLPLTAICAAPSILGKLGLLNGKKATCFPGFEQYLSGATVCDCGVVTDGNVITARALGAAHEFAFAIIRMLKDEGTAEQVRASVFYEA